MEESVLCGGVLLRLIDTAGIRDTEDTVEQLGVERSRRALAAAELVLAVVDGSAVSTEEDEEILLPLPGADPLDPGVHQAGPMPGALRTAMAPVPAGEAHWPRLPPWWSLSSVTGEGLQDLENAVAALLPAGDPARRVTC